MRTYDVRTGDVVVRRADVLTCLPSWREARRCGQFEDEARKLAETDPLAQVGRLSADLHPWMTAKGVFR